MDGGWTSNTDQILTLSLFYTGDISEHDCIDRFSNRSYIGKLYDKEAEITKQHPWGKLTDEIDLRYRILINLLHDRPDLIEGRGDFEIPTLPTFTSCRLTEAGLKLAPGLALQFPAKPEFPNWPDNRTMKVSD